MILEEAIEEAVGGSSKRWALILIAFVVGGVAALVLAQRMKGAPDDRTQPPEPGAHTRPA